MKIFISILCFVLLCCGSSWGQDTEWAPIGAEWTTMPDEDFNIVRTIAVKDTVFQGQPCKLLSNTSYSFGDYEVKSRSKSYTYAKNDSVFFYNSDFQRFQLTYDFTAQVGDTLTFPAAFEFQDQDSFKVVVTDIGDTAMIWNRSFPLRFVTVENEWGSTTYYDKIGTVRGLASIDYKFSFVIPGGIGLVCYQDNTFEYTTDIEEFTQFCGVEINRDLNWAPVGAEWYHVSVNGSDGRKTLALSRVEKDTIIAERRYQKIVNNLEVLFTYMENDSVFYLNENYPEPILLYDFTAETGDTVTYLAPDPNLYDWDSDTFLIRVDSVTFTTHNNISGRIKHFHTTTISDTNYRFDNGYYENIGALTEVFLPSADFFTPGSSLNLRCYNNSFFNVNFTNGLPCIPPLPNNVEDLSEWNINIYPTLLAETRTVQIEMADTYRNIQLKITDQYGRTTHTETFHSSAFDLSLASYSSGMYFLTLEIEGRLFVQKLLVL